MQCAGQAACIYVAQPGQTCPCNKQHQASCATVRACRLIEIMKPAGERQCDVAVGGISATEERIAKGYRFSVSFVPQRCMSPNCCMPAAVSPHCCMPTACRAHHEQLPKLGVSVMMLAENVCCAASMCVLLLHAFRMVHVVVLEPPTAPVSCFAVTAPHRACMNTLLHQHMYPHLMSSQLTLTIGMFLTPHVCLPCSTFTPLSLQYPTYESGRRILTHNGVDYDMW